MKPDYKNWVPKGLLAGFYIGDVVSLIILLIIRNAEIFTGTALTVATIIVGILFLAFVFMSVYLTNLYCAFSYTGKKQISARIVNKVSDYVKLPENGEGLDVGCGSAALTISCARKNPQGKMTGLDRWGKEYASFSKQLCENNARAEGVENISFVQGDACKLDFPDETFDVITSNYVYHNIPSRDRQSIILESLRTLKKGGTFVIHDYFTKAKYGDLTKLFNKLEDMGYEKVEFLDTTTGLFFTPKESAILGLKGSGLLNGKK